MSTKNNAYETFEAQRNRVVALLDKAVQVFRKLDMSGWTDVATRLSERLRSERFRVIVLGEFKRGKSTFINALLHEEMLPAFVTPCTAVIGEVKWGEHKRAVLHFRNPLPTPLPHHLNQDAARHLERNRTRADIPPMEIDVRDLEDFVTIPDAAKDQNASVSESPFDRVELFWPLELCRNGVEIIDSPGLNEHRTRTKTTRDYLSQVDAVIFVMSVHALASESELAVIDRDVRGSGHDSLFFVCNRFDELRKAADREHVMAFARQKLSDRTEFGRDGIYFLSAQDALDGRLQGDASRVERSGILPLERSLARFLVRDRGRVKLLQPASQLSRGLKLALHEAIPARLRMLQADLQNLRQRYNEARPLLDQASQRREQLIQTVNNTRLQLRDKVRRSAQQFLRELAALIPAWGHEVKLDRELNLLKAWTMKEQEEQLVKDVLGQLQPRIDSAMAEWDRNRLRPLLAQEVDQLTQGVNASLRTFLDQLDQLRADLTLNLGAGLPEVSELTGKPISPWERVVAGAGGLLLNPGAAITGTAFGYKGILHGLLPQFGAVFCALLLGVTNPIMLGGILLSTGVGQTLLKGTKMTNDAKHKVVQRLAAYILESAPDRADEIAEEVYQQTNSISEAIARGMDREIQGVREQVEAVLSIKQEGEAKVTAQRAELTKIEAEIRAIDADLTNVTYSVAQLDSV